MEENINIKEVRPHLFHYLVYAYPSIQKMYVLCAKADAAITHTEEAEAKNRQLEQQLLEKEQGITSLDLQIACLKGKLQFTQEKLAQAKTAQEEHSETENDSLRQKVIILEEELDAPKKNIKQKVKECIMQTPTSQDPVLIVFLECNDSSISLRSLSTRCNLHSKSMTSG